MDRDFDPGSSGRASPEDLPIPEADATFGGVLDGPSVEPGAGDEAAPDRESEPVEETARFDAALGVRQALGRSADLFLSNPISWLVIIGIVQIPLSVAVIILPGTGWRYPAEFISVFSGGAISWAMALRWQGKRASTREAYAAAASKFGSLIGANLVVGAAVGGTIGLGAIIAFLMAGAGSSAVAIAIAVATTMISGLIAVRYSVTNQALMIEGLRWRTSYQRSGALTKGRVRYAAAVVVPGTIITMVPVAIAAAAAALSGLPEAAVGLIVGVAWTVGGALLAAILTVTYFQLRRREQLPVDLLHERLGTANDVPVRTTRVRAGLYGVFAIGSLVLSAVVYQQLTAPDGLLTFERGRGHVVFGLAPGADACSVGQAVTAIDSSQRTLYWSASMARTIKKGESFVFTLFEDDKKVNQATDIASDAADCMRSSNDGFTNPGPGRWKITVTVSGVVVSSGELLIR